LEIIGDESETLKIRTPFKAVWASQGELHDESFSQRKLSDSEDKDPSGDSTRLPSGCVWQP
jgi:hypothetical protein